VTSILESEIRDQAHVVRRRLDDGWTSSARAAGLLNRPDVTHVVLAARGSSDNAARYAQYLLGRDARKLLTLAAPYLYRSPAGAPMLGPTAVLGISQSGASPDVVAVLLAARAQARPTIALTNAPRSPLAGAADLVVPLLSGEERSVAATKTFTASLVALVQIAEALAPQPGRREELAALPGLLDRMVDEQLDARARFDPLVEAGWFTVVGRGLSYAAAHETALKLRELSAVPAEAFSPPDLVHGPIAAVGQGTVAWAIAGSRSQADELRPVWRELLARGARGVAVTTEAAILPGAAIELTLPSEAPAWAVPLLAVVGAQAAGLRLAELTGVHVDTPHGLDKVTRTR
jgi:glucosamine--fructose-6-phosphate aminotransferase (isomerizing)